MRNGWAGDWAVCGGTVVAGFAWVGGQVCSRGWQITVVVAEFGARNGQIVVVTAGFGEGQFKAGWD